MNLNFFRNIVFFIILVVVQTLVLNHIRLFGCATPLLYVYFVLPTRRDTPRWQTLLLSFAIGLAVDVFSNTPGVGAASMTLLGLLQPYLLTLFVPRDVRHARYVEVCQLHHLHGAGLLSDVLHA